MWRNAPTMAAIFLFCWPHTHRLAIATATVVPTNVWHQQNDAANGGETWNDFRNELPLVQLPNSNAQMPSSLQPQANNYQQPLPRKVQLVNPGGVENQDVQRAFNQQVEPIQQFPTTQNRVLNDRNAVGNGIYSTLPVYAPAHEEIIQRDSVVMVPRQIPSIQSPLWNNVVYSHGSQPPLSIKNIPSPPISPQTYEGTYPTVYGQASSSNAEASSFILPWNSVRDRQFPVPYSNNKPDFNDRSSIDGQGPERRNTSPLSNTGMLTTFNSVGSSVFPSPNILQSQNFFYSGRGQEPPAIKPPVTNTPIINTFPQNPMNNLQTEPRLQIDGTNHGVHSIAMQPPEITGGVGNFYTDIPQPKLPPQLPFNFHQNQNNYNGPEKLNEQNLKTNDQMANGPGYMMSNRNLQTPLYPMAIPSVLPIMKEAVLGPPVNQRNRIPYPPASYTPNTFINPGNFGSPTAKQSVPLVSQSSNSLHLKNGAPEGGMRVQEHHENRLQDIVNNKRVWQNPESPNSQEQHFDVHQQNILYSNQGPTQTPTLVGMTHQPQPLANYIDAPTGFFQMSSLPVNEDLRTNSLHQVPTSGQSYGSRVFTDGLISKDNQYMNPADIGSFSVATRAKYMINPVGVSQTVQPVVSAEEPQKVIPRGPPLTDRQNENVMPVEQRTSTDNINSKALNYVHNESHLGGVKTENSAPTLEDPTGGNKKEPVFQRLPIFSVVGNTPLDFPQSPQEWIAPYKIPHAQKISNLPHSSAFQFILPQHHLPPLPMVVLRDSSKRVFDQRGQPHIPFDEESMSSGAFLNSMNVPPSRATVSQNPPQEEIYRSFEQLNKPQYPQPLVGWPSNNLPADIGSGRNTNRYETKSGTYSDSHNYFMRGNTNKQSTDDNFESEVNKGQLLYPGTNHGTTYSVSHSESTGQDLRKQMTESSRPQWAHDGKIEKIYSKVQDQPDHLDNSHSGQNGRVVIGENIKSSSRNLLEETYENLDGVEASQTSAAKAQSDIRGTGNDKQKTIPMSVKFDTVGVKDEQNIWFPTRLSQSLMDTQMPGVPEPKKEYSRPETIHMYNQQVNLDENNGTQTKFNKTRQQLRRDEIINDPDINPTGTGDSNYKAPYYLHSQSQYYPSEKQRSSLNSDSKTGSRYFNNQNAEINSDTITNGVYQTPTSYQGEATMYGERLHSEIIDEKYIEEQMKKKMNSKINEAIMEDSTYKNIEPSQTFSQLTPSQLAKKPLSNLDRSVISPFADDYHNVKPSTQTKLDNQHMKSSKLNSQKTYSENNSFSEDGINVTTSGQSIIDRRANDGTYKNDMYEDNTQSLIDKQHASNKLLLEQQHSPILDFERVSSVGWAYAQGNADELEKLPQPLSYDTARPSSFIGPYGLTNPLDKFSNKDGRNIPTENPLMKETPGKYSAEDWYKGFKQRQSNSSYSEQPNNFQSFTTSQGSRNMDSLSQTHFLEGEVSDTRSNLETQQTFPTEFKADKFYSSITEMLKQPHDSTEQSRPFLSINSDGFETSPQQEDGKNLNKNLKADEHPASKMSEKSHFQESKIIQDLDRRDQTREYKSSLSKQSYNQKSYLTLPFPIDDSKYIVPNGNEVNHQRISGMYDEDQRHQSKSTTKIPVRTDMPSDYVEENESGNRSMLPGRSPINEYGEAEVKDNTDQRAKEPALRQPYNTKPPTPASLTEADLQTQIDEFAKDETGNDGQDIRPLKVITKDVGQAIPPQLQKETIADSTTDTYKLKSIRDELYPISNSEAINQDQQHNSMNPSSKLTRLKIPLVPSSFSDPEQAYWIPSTDNYENTNQYTINGQFPEYTDLPVEYDHKRLAGNRNMLSTVHDDYGEHVKVRTEQLRHNEPFVRQPYNTKQPTVAYATGSDGMLFSPETVKNEFEDGIETTTFHGKAAVKLVSEAQIQEKSKLYQTQSPNEKPYATKPLSVSDYVYILPNTENNKQRVTVNQPPDFPNLYETYPLSGNSNADRAPHTNNNENTKQYTVNMYDEHHRLPSQTTTGEYDQGRLTGNRNISPNLYDDQRIHEEPSLKQPNDAKSSRPYSMTTPDRVDAFPQTINNEFEERVGTNRFHGQYKVTVKFPSEDPNREGSKLSQKQVDQQTIEQNYQSNIVSEKPHTHENSQSILRNPTYQKLGAMQPSSQAQATNNEYSNTNGTKHDSTTTLYDGFQRHPSTVARYLENTELPAEYDHERLIEDRNKTPSKSSILTTTEQFRQKDFDVPYNAKPSTSSSMPDSDRMYIKSQTMDKESDEGYIFPNTVNNEFTEALGATFHGRGQYKVAVKFVSGDTNQEVSTLSQKEINRDNMDDKYESSRTDIRKDEDAKKQYKMNEDQRRSSTLPAETNAMGSSSYGTLQTESSIGVLEQNDELMGDLSPKSHPYFGQRTLDEETDAGTYLPINSSATQNRNKLSSVTKLSSDEPSNSRIAPNVELETQPGEKNLMVSSPTSTLQQTKANRMNSNPYTVRQIVTEQSNIITPASKLPNPKNENTSPLPKADRANLIFHTNNDDATKPYKITVYDEDQRRSSKLTTAAQYQENEEYPVEYDNGRLTEERNRPPYTSGRLPTNEYSDDAYIKDNTDQSKLKGPLLEQSYNTKPPSAVWYQDNTDLDYGGLTGNRKVPPNMSERSPTDAYKDPAAIYNTNQIRQQDPSLKQQALPGSDSTSKINHTDDYDTTKQYTITVYGNDRGHTSKSRTEVQHLAETDTPVEYRSLTGSKNMLPNMSGMSQTNKYDEANVKFDAEQSGLNEPSLKQLNIVKSSSVLNSEGVNFKPQMVFEGDGETTSKVITQARYSASKPLSVAGLKDQTTYEEYKLLSKISDGLHPVENSDRVNLDLAFTPSLQLANLKNIYKTSPLPEFDSTNRIPQTDNDYATTQYITILDDAARRLETTGMPVEYEHERLTEYRNKIPVTLGKSSTTESDSNVKYLKNQERYTTSPSFKQFNMNHLSPSSPGIDGTYLSTDTNSDGPRNQGKASVFDEEEKGRATTLVFQFNTNVPKDDSEAMVAMNQTTPLNEQYRPPTPTKMKTSESTKDLQSSKSQSAQYLNVPIIMQSQDTINEKTTGKITANPNESAFQSSGQRFVESGLESTTEGMVEEQANSFIGTTSENRIIYGSHTSEKPFKSQSIPPGSPTGFKDGSQTNAMSPQSALLNTRIPGYKAISDDDIIKYLEFTQKIPGSVQVTATYDSPDDETVFYHQVSSSKGATTSSTYGLQTTEGGYTRPDDDSYDTSVRNQVTAMKYDDPNKPSSHPYREAPGRLLPTSNSMKPPTIKTHFDDIQEGVTPIEFSTQVPTSFSESFIASGIPERDDTAYTKQTSKIRGHISSSDGKIVTSEGGVLTHRENSSEEYTSLLGSRTISAEEGKSRMPSKFQQPLLSKDQTDTRGEYTRPQGGAAAEERLNYGGSSSFKYDTTSSHLASRKIADSTPDYVAVEATQKNENPESTLQVGGERLQGSNFLKTDVYPDRYRNLVAYHEWQKNIRNTTAEDNHSLTTDNSNLTHEESLMTEKSQNNSKLLNNYSEQQYQNSGNNNKRLLIDHQPQPENTEDQGVVEVSSETGESVVYSVPDSQTFSQRRRKPISSPSSLAQHVSSKGNSEVFSQDHTMAPQGVSSSTLFDLWMNGIEINKANQTSKVIKSSDTLISRLKGTMLDSSPAHSDHHFSLGNSSSSQDQDYKTFEPQPVTSSSSTSDRNILLKLSTDSKVDGPVNTDSEGYQLSSSYLLSSESIKTEHPESLSLVSHSQNETYRTAMDTLVKIHDENQITNNTYTDGEKTVSNASIKSPVTSSPILDILRSSQLRAQKGYDDSVLDDSLAMNATKVHEFNNSMASHLENIEAAKKLQFNHGLVIGITDINQAKVTDQITSTVTQSGWKKVKDSTSITDAGRQSLAQKNQDQLLESSTPSLNAPMAYQGIRDHIANYNLENTGQKSSDQEGMDSTKRGDDHERYAESSSKDGDRETLEENMQGNIINITLTQTGWKLAQNSLQQLGVDKHTENITHSEEPFSRLGDIGLPNTSKQHYPYQNVSASSPSTDLGTNDEVGTPPRETNSMMSSSSSTSQPESSIILLEQNGPSNLDHQNLKTQVYSGQRTLSEEADEETNLSIHNNSKLKLSSILPVRPSKDSIVTNVALETSAGDTTPEVSSSSSILQPKSSIDPLKQNFNVMNQHNSQTGAFSGERTLGQKVTKQPDHTESGRVRKPCSLGADSEPTVVVKIVHSSVEKTNSVLASSLSSAKREESSIDLLEQNDKVLGQLNQAYSGQHTLGQKVTELLDHTKSSAVHKQCPPATDTDPTVVVKIVQRPVEGINSLTASTLSSSTSAESSIDLLEQNYEILGQLNLKTQSHSGQRTGEETNSSIQNRSKLKLPSIIPVKGSNSSIVTNGELETRAVDASPSVSSFPKILQPKSSIDLSEQNDKAVSEDGSKTHAYSGQTPLGQKVIEQLNHTGSDFVHKQCPPETDADPVVVVKIVQRPVEALNSVSLSDVPSTARPEIPMNIWEQNDKLPSNLSLKTDGYSGQRTSQDDADEGTNRPMKSPSQSTEKSKLPSVTSGEPQNKSIVPNIASEILSERSNSKVFSSSSTLQPDNSTDTLERNDKVLSDPSSNTHTYSGSTLAEETGDGNYLLIISPGRNEDKSEVRSVTLSEQPNNSSVPNNESESRRGETSLKMSSSSSTSQLEIAIDMANTGRGTNLPIKSPSQYEEKFDRSSVTPSDPANISLVLNSESDGRQGETNRRESSSSSTIQPERSIDILEQNEKIITDPSSKIHIYSGQRILGEDTDNGASLPIKSPSQNKEKSELPSVTSGEPPNNSIRPNNQSESRPGETNQKVSSSSSILKPDEPIGIVEQNKKVLSDPSSKTYSHSGQHTLGKETGAAFNLQIKLPSQNMNKFSPSPITLGDLDADELEYQNALRTLSNINSGNFKLFTAEYFIQLIQRCNCASLKFLIPILQRPNSGILVTS